MTNLPARAELLAREAAWFGRDTANTARSGQHVSLGTYETLGFPIYVPCELHGEAQCSTCYHEPGECDYGACHAPAEHRVAFHSVMTTCVVDVRFLCDKHTDKIARTKEGGPRVWTEIRPVHKV